MTMNLPQALIELAVRVREKARRFTSSAERSGIAY